jgi:hypothetical protein
MLGVEPNISVEFSHVNMTKCETKQGGSTFHVQFSIGPWLLPCSNVNNCTASSVVVETSAEGGSTMYFVNFSDNNPCYYWAIVHINLSAVLVGSRRLMQWWLRRLFVFDSIAVAASISGK